MQSTNIDPNSTVAALSPVIVLLASGVGIAIACRAIKISPIIGYIVLGLVLGEFRAAVRIEEHFVSALAELGVVFLLFDLGLHFSLERLRSQARDIFGFGPAQIVFGTVGIGALGWLLGLPPVGAALIGATLALSSTAVVGSIIAERHQQSCPVGLTAMAILIFQDIAGIFLLIVAATLGSGESILPLAGYALGQACLAFIAAALLAWVVVRPLFDLIVRSGNEEVFTGTALLIALSAAWATGMLGLSLSLGAFLGGMIVSETPYRALMQSEIKPFRGLLLGLFFMSVGYSLDLAALLNAWVAVVVAVTALVTVKIVTNSIAALAFRWSVPGSVQLGFLLAQGSEFALFIFGLPAVRTLIGGRHAQILIAAIVVSLGLTPLLAEIGRYLAGRLRTTRSRWDHELQPGRHLEPILIVGLGTIGRALADALSRCGVEYLAIERDERRLREGVADGYRVAFGDFSDPKIWTSLGMSERKAMVLTSPRFEVSDQLAPTARRLFPSLKRIAVANDADEVGIFASLGMTAFDRNAYSTSSGLLADLLKNLGVPPAIVSAWIEWGGRQDRSLEVAA